MREISVKTDAEFAEYLADTAEELMFMLMQYVQEHPNGELACRTLGSGTIISASISVSMQQSESDDLAATTSPATFDFSVGACKSKKRLIGYKWRDNRWYVTSHMGKHETELKLLDNEGERR